MNEKDIIRIAAPVDEIYISAVRMFGPLPEMPLNPEEHAELQKLQQEFRRREYLVSRWLLRNLAEKYLTGPGMITVRKEASGRPVGLVDDRSYHVSISHTRDFVAVALSEKYRVGLDIEKAHRIVSSRLRERILHPDERKNLESCSTLRIWTLKESVLKLTGMGLRANMNGIKLMVGGDNVYSTIWMERVIHIFSFESGDMMGSLSIFDEEA